MVVAGVVVGGLVVVVVGGLVVVVVGGTVVVVVVGGATVVVVVSGTARLNMSCEKPKAAWRPAAAPIPGGRVLDASGSMEAGAEVGAVASASSELGENAAKAAIARRAITTQVANAKSRVNLTPVNFRVLNNRTTMRQHAWNRMKARAPCGGKPHREKQPRAVVPPSLPSREMKIDQYLTADSIAAGADYAIWAESLGFDGLFTAETGHDPFLPIAAAAGRTDTIQFGTAIAVAFARSPMTVAYTAWDLAEATGGRFLLGLWTQIRAHIVRRFNMPWSSPGPRLREYIAALRAIWETWQTGNPLSFDGDFYEFKLMTPFFSPPPMPHADIPIYIAGVGEYMCRVAGETADGFHVHPFHTLGYLEEVVMPNMEKGAELAGRSVADVELVTGAFVITGRTEEEVGAARMAAKLQIAFYASTPAYRGVLELHDWDFGPELTAMSKRGDWMAMGELIPDEVVDQVAVTAPLDSLGSAVRAKYEGRLDRVGFYFPDLPGQPPLVDLTDEEWAGLVAGVHA